MFEEITTETNDPIDDILTASTLQIIVFLLSNFVLFYSTNIQFFKQDTLTYQNWIKA